MDHFLLITPKLVIECYMIVLFYIQNAGKKEASYSQMLGHIKQLKPLLQANEDVILSVQIGFIGVWGKYWVY